MRRVFLFSPTFALFAATFPAVAGATSTTCATTVVCAEYINTSSGVAVHGEANSGIGIRGTSVSNTGFYGASGSGSAGTPGVEGESTNGTGNDAAGAFGLAYLSGRAAPAYGAIAYGSSYGIFGEAANVGTSSSAGYGLYGLDPVSSVSNSTDSNVAVVGRTTVGTAMLAEANGVPNSGDLFGFAPIGLYAVGNKFTGTKNGNAFAIFAETNSFGLDIHNTTNSSTVYVSSPSSLIQGNATTGSFYFDYSGNEFISGTLTTNKGTYVRMTGRRGVAMREYGARTTAPDVEDVGEGQLANGRAFIPIDARLAETIDRRAIYHVFVTPEGDCNGLYVTQKSPTGFAVRELRGGRSTLAFVDRIVAKPFDENGARLATMPPETLANDGVSDGAVTATRGVGASPPLSPDAVMKRRLGPRGYAGAMSAIRARESSR